MTKSILYDNLSGGSGAMESARAAVEQPASGEKTKAQLRAERRAIQEAQRAAKAERQAAGPPRAETQVDQPSTSPDQHQTAELPEAFTKLQPNCGVNSCLGDPETMFLAVVEALREFIVNFRQPSNKSGPREIDTVLKSTFQSFADGVPLPPNVATLVKQLNWQISQMSDELSEAEVKKVLLEWLEDFVEQNVKLSSDAISITVAGIFKSMNSKPVVLTYLGSSLVAKCLTDAHSQGIDFETVIIDDAPQGKGLHLLKELTPKGVKCRYGVLTGIGLLLDGVKVVLVGAVGVLANGNVVTPLGTCQVALIASTRNIPVLVLCQTYKFCELVMTSCNEVRWHDCEVLPSDLVTGVVTEIRILPCTAVPAVLRVRQPA